MKKIKLFSVFTILLVLCSCKNNAQTKKETPSTPVAKTNTKLVTETVESANRLTKESILSFFPKEILNQKYKGVTSEKVSKPDSQTGALNYSYSELYGKYSEIKITITDFSDDQAHINNMEKYGRTEDANETEWSSFKIYKHASGLYFFESFEKNEGEVIEGTLVISNPRFDIEIQSKKQITRAYKPDALYEALKQTNLMKLFDLPIPKRQNSINVAKSNNLKILKCDDLLPINVVKSICNKTVSIKTTSFEKDNNCNRFYPDENSTGALIFMVTQYSKASSVKSTVKVDKGKMIPNLGDIAVYIKEKGGNEYLKAGYENYVIELQSTKNLDKDGVCYTEKELIKLMKKVIDRLSKI